MSKLKSYLGLINYHQKFLPNLSSLLAPLYRLLQKNNRWNWGRKEQQAFQESKLFLKSSKLLVHNDDQKELTSACDASQNGLGAVLSHKMEDGSEHPICFASRTLTQAERKSSNLEREVLSSVWD